MTERATIIRADRSLKKKLDSTLPLEYYFTPELIARAEEVIANYREPFIAHTAPDIQALRRSSQQLHGAAEKGDAQAAVREVGRVIKLAFTLRGRAGSFGFSLMSAIAASLQRYASQLSRLRREDALVIQAHADALAAALREDPEGGGGIRGRALMASLRRLVEKFRAG